MARLTIVQAVMGPALAMVCGCAVSGEAPPPPEPLASTNAAVGNGKEDRDERFPFVARLVATDANDPTKGSLCTGVLVTPTKLVTANHCITGTGGCGGGLVAVPPGDPLYTRTWTITFKADPTAGPTFNSHPTIPVAVRKFGWIDSCSNNDSSRDIAVITLSGLVPPRTRPDGTIDPNGVDPIKPVTDGGCGSGFSATAVGFGRVSAPFPYGSGAIVTPQFRTWVDAGGGWARDDHPDGETFFSDWIWPEPYRANLQGDSGGPLLKDGSGFCGVASRNAPKLVRIGFPPFAGIWVPGMVSRYAAIDSAEATGFVRNAIQNADGTYKGECAKGPTDSRFRDTDGDLIPDGCDNCPSVANSGQEDFDHDNVGDVCDNAPRKGNPRAFFGAPQADADGDGVGDADDNCEKPNPVRACRVDTDCFVGGYLGKQFCVAGTASEPFVPFGRCLGAGTICKTSVDCPGLSACLGVATFGRCAAQTDDNDYDLVGDRCDTCKGLWSGEIQANSNDIAEKQQTANELGDFCDPVPTFSSRAVYRFPKDGAEKAAFKKVSQFDTRAMLGLDIEQSAPTVVALPDENANVGFRHCSCVQTIGSAVVPIEDADECKRARVCDYDPGTFDGGTWCKVTASSNAKVFPEKGTEVAALFTRTQTCDDKTLFGPGVTTERCLLGTAGSLYWNHGSDLTDTSCFYSFPDSTGDQRSYGLWWSRVAVGSSTVSPRDTKYLGRLRNNYEFVTTPLIGILPPATAIPEIPDCPPGAGGCGFPWRIDLLGIIKGNPVDDIVRGPWSVSRLVKQSDGRVLAISDSTAIAPAVTEQLSLGVRSILSDPSRRWLTFVESGRRARVAAAGLSGVSVPVAWNGTESSIATVISANGAMALGDEIQQPPHNIVQMIGPAAKTAAPVDPPAAVPGARTGSGWTFSATERAVFLVGGRTGSTANNDVWRYDVDPRTWTRLYAGPMEFGQVLAVTYDDLSGVLTVLDHVENKFKPLTARARLLTIDVRSGAATVIHNVAHGATYGRVALVQQDGGSRVLLVQRSAATTWSACRFEPSPSGAVKWTGIASGQGSLLDGAFATPGEILVPVLSGTQQSIVSLRASSFLTGGGCNDL